MATEKFKIYLILLLLAGFLSYSVILYSYPPVKASFDAEADMGKMVWQKYNCSACHQFYGLGGYLGPDLTNVYSFRGEEFIKAMLTAGPGMMPEFRLTEAETEQLLAFLKSVDASGKSDPRTFTVSPDGTVSQH